MAKINWRDGVLNYDVSFTRQLMIGRWGACSHFFVFFIPLKLIQMRRKAVMDPC